MRYLFVIYLNLIITVLKAQTSENIIAELKTINKTITTKDCNINAVAISNRAMNIFLADKTGYLSGSKNDLSFYTNYVTINSAEGKITINHNIENATEIDEPIKKLFSIGIDATIANQFAATFLNKSFENELGPTLNYKWLGKVKTHFLDHGLNKNNANQKQQMDALRAGILHLLEIEINKKDSLFKNSLNLIDSANDLPDQNIDSAKAMIGKSFYTNLKDEYEAKFATLQAETLTSTGNFKLITIGWTSINAYIPLVTPKYAVAQSYNTAFQNKRSYPLDITITHTRLWESNKAGRIFVTIGGDFLLNNSKLSYRVDKTTYSDYKLSGGTDTTHLAELKNNKAFIGDYQTFITPSIKARFVYYPADTHFGIGFSLEQSFGKYNPLNGKITIPIVLINSKKTPAVNFNFDILFLDITNNYAVIKKAGNKTFVALQVGIPFSRLIF